MKFNLLILFYISISLIHSLSFANDEPRLGEAHEFIERLFDESGHYTEDVSYSYSGSLCKSMIERHLLGESGRTYNLNIEIEWGQISQSTAHTSGQYSTSRIVLDGNIFVHGYSSTTENYYERHKTFFPFILAEGYPERMSRAMNHLIEHCDLSSEDPF